ncbi:hypothetical protein AK830_g10523 [Neonectria ditissima]|uniref:Alpha/beta hydrolase fold-3 domain-containing protein n=1 Tax=Neonectria ditissima TaxID=78410 RepID=A0A0N8H5F6_9HYPO|nr:hypothetical protein AK830_g10523 [Neonectria ditissima]
MAFSFFSNFSGYGSHSFTYKAADKLDLKLEVLAPRETDTDPTPVLLHYHGGWLIIGDRHSVQPHWLINACIRRRWIFVSPDYRLMPESTAHASVDDAVDAYEWVLKRLATELDITIGPVVLSGSSAGAYLALTVASITPTKPRALFLLYGMLDPADERYTTTGTNVLGLPPIEAGPILAQYASSCNENDGVRSGYPWPNDLATDPRFALIQAMHMEALIPDRLTGIVGLSKAIATRGLETSIPASAQRLFPKTFADLSEFPPTMIFHGKNDNVVPCRLSQSTAETLKDAGVNITTEFPDDAHHAFDVHLGDVDLEDALAEERLTPGIQGLRNVIEFLDGVAGI